VGEQETFVSGGRNLPILGLLRMKLYLRLAMLMRHATMGSILMVILPSYLEVEDEELLYYVS
jgi:hypothetical protein